MRERRYSPLFGGCGDGKSPPPPCMVASSGGVSESCWSE